MSLEPTEAPKTHESDAKCPNCGMGVSYIDKLCPACGYDLSHEATTAEKRQLKCEKCGAEFEGTGYWCEKCVKADEDATAKKEQFWMIVKAIIAAYFILGLIGGAIFGIIYIFSHS